jgi:hypothetical protein
VTRVTDRDRDLLDEQQDSLIARAQERTPEQSDRSDSVLIPVHAICSTIPPAVVSSRKIDTWRRRKQDAVKIPLTKYAVDELAISEFEAGTYEGTGIPEGGSDV